MPAFELDKFGGTGGGDGREAREEYEGGGRGEGTEKGDGVISRCAASALSAYSRTPPPQALPSDWPIWTPPSRPPASRPPRSLSVGGVSKWGVSDCRLVLSELATDLHTPLCSWLCFCTLFCAMVFTVCSCTFSIYICLLFLCLAFSLQGGEAGGVSGRSCRSLHRLMLISTCLIALDCRFTWQN